MAKDKEEKIVLNEWASTLSCYFRAMLPGMFLQTAEESRVLTQLVSVIHNLGVQKCGCRELFVWSDSSFKEWVLFSKPDAAGAEANPETSETIKVLPNKEFFQAIKDFAKPDSTSPLRHKAAVLVLCDPGNALQSPTNCRVLREALADIRGWRKTIVLIGRSMNLPKELQPDLFVIPFELPTTDELFSVIHPLIMKYPTFKGYENIVIKEDAIRPFARACSGLTEEEMRTLVGLSIAKFKAFDDRAVEMALKEKSQIVRRSETLECHNPTSGLDSVGGLEHIKSWIAEVTPIFQNPDKARAYGLTLPPGLLLLGLPGTGKSLTARTLAAHWKLPLLRFDVGKAFGSLVGQSEANIRDMIALATAAKPCVLMIDEIEKGLGGSSLDGGTSSRVLATLLTWLEEKPDEVFVVATANDLRKLQTMPELISRFSDSFFVDLPNLHARKEILEIHLRERGHLLGDAVIDKVAEETRGYSGRELRNVVRKGLGIAFLKNLKHPTLKIMQQAITGITPTSKTMKEAIADLRKWTEAGRAQPAGSVLEGADDDVADNNLDSSVNGLPDLGS